MYTYWRSKWFAFGNLKGDYCIVSSGVVKVREFEMCLPARLPKQARSRLSPDSSLNVFLYLKEGVEWYTYWRSDWAGEERGAVSQSYENGSLE